MAMTELNYGESGGGGSVTWYAETPIPSAETLTFACTDAMFVIYGTGQPFYTVFLENGVVTKGATGDYSTTATYSNGTLTLNIGQGYYGNNLKGIYY